jgi:hypothetical protein
MTRMFVPEVPRTRRRARFAPPYCLEPRRPMLPVQTDKANYREWRCKVLPGIEVVVWQVNRAAVSEAVNDWESFWRLKGIEGYLHGRRVVGGPQQAANAATRELRKLARSILAGGIAA